MLPVHVIGLGLGPEDLTPSMAEIIAKSQVLAGGRRLLDWFKGHKAESLELSGGMGAWLDAVAGAAETQHVVVLASGDPSFFGVAGSVIKRLGRDNVVVAPNISAMQAACAQLGLQWGRAAHVSLHATAENALGSLWRAMAFHDLVSVYTRPGMGPADIAAILNHRGLGGWRMHVLEDLGSASERIGLYEPGKAADMDFSALSVILLERVGHPARLHLGMPEEAYEHENSLITKAEVRAVALARLELGPDLTLWDLGAGSGSLGLEASLLLPGGQVVAVEQNPGRVEMIKANRARFGVGLLEVVQGAAPEALAELPLPDRVFIGGGGKDLAAIIRASAEVLSPGGVIVVSAVLLQSLEAARTALAEAGLAVDETLLQVSRGVPVAGQTMMGALNPVWLVRGKKAPGDKHNE